MAQDSTWPPQWLRGVLEIATLAVVAEKPIHGYEVARRLEQAGLGRIGGGTLYPLLSRLEQDGAVSSNWQEGQGGPGRKYFTVTEVGRDRLRSQSLAWIEFAQRTVDLLQNASGARHD